MTQSLSKKLGPVWANAVHVEIQLPQLAAGIAPQRICNQLDFGITNPVAMAAEIQYRECRRPSKSAGHD
eukprot:CAMPEP_0178587968 /NCGR_PEP_ID=MMETSP0697-20121206/26756_1 /TAXON_ID=265572 /ORGANISM="Extubocellulus spinifer, Strain CCMP396" /LENGTH=68 /DNA_ID=CAMNT_0020224233 /DNA_START=37 /DNA_END=243 /DNA_ORIENTATION=-